MNNQELLKLLSLSFKKYIETGSRSNEKLIVLHGGISKDIQERLGNEYCVCSLGINEGKELLAKGRYFDKRVDIAISKDNEIIAAIGLKFVMSNYSQNSNNYFENMLGETANIRCGGVPYFQIFIIPDRLPYFKSNGEIAKWEEFSGHNAAKYEVMSKDKTEITLHTPVKTLLHVISIDFPDTIKNRNEYTEYFKKKGKISISNSNTFSGIFESKVVILNNYEMFIQKVCMNIQSI